MAYAIEVTIGTGNKVSLNYQSQDVNVSITYRLEREDADVLALVRDKADELMRVHALAWKRVKEGERPEPMKEEEKLAEEAPVVEDAQKNVIENAEFEDTATATVAQVRLLYALSGQAGLNADELTRKIKDGYGCEIPEELKRDEAAKLLVELGREERERFERERARSPKRREPDEETTP